MLIRLSAQEIPPGDKNESRPLSALGTRSLDDPAIALLDAWAAVLDVLTFYQERIANEGYLRTATERRSVLELARAIGYELNPGVAASTYLAFTVEDTPGSPGEAVVPEGTRVQSLPARGNLPQTFETSEEIKAKARWNKLLPRLTLPQNLTIHDGNLYLMDTECLLLPNSTIEQENLRINDLHLVEDVTFKENVTEVRAVRIQQIYLKENTLNLKAGTCLLLAGKRKRDGEIKTIVKSVKKVEAEPEQERIIVELEEGKGEKTEIFTATPAMNFYLASTTPSWVKFNEEKVKKHILNATLTERDLNALVAVNNWNENDLLRHLSVPEKKGPAPADLGVFAFWERTGFFGHNAPMHATLPVPENTRGKSTGGGGDPYQNDWDKNETTIWENSQGTDYETLDNGPHVYLERSIPEILSNSWVVFEASGGVRQTYRVNKASEASLVDYAISGKAIGLFLTDPAGSSLTESTKNEDFKVRKTTALVRSERLELADLPIEEPLEELEQKQGSFQEKGASSIVLDRLVPGLRVGQPLVLSGEQVDAAGVIRHEVVILKDIIHNKGYTTLYFKDRLQYRYVRKTVTLNANVVRATHGETVKEVLGSGDGSKVNQRFVLKKPPLTYVPAPNPRGSKSTLSVHVNDVLWEEVPSLYSAGATGRNYIVRIEDDGRTGIIFGDGKKGSRLPSGTENLVVTYRNGIGSEGEVEAGSLKLLQTRPPEIRDVTNPLPATGADEPEKLDGARENAPLTVLTFDRIVSLKDFENFARNFGGIGKARAVVLPRGESQIVHITVAAASGKEIETTSELYTNLVNAIKAACDPVQQVRVDSFKLLLFNLKAKVKIKSEYIPEIVLEAASKILQTAFAFEKRSFAQPVTAAEVICLIQKVEGVDAVTLENLYTSDTEPLFNQVLSVSDASWPALQAEPEPAELLLVNSAGITLEEVRE